MQGDTLRQAVGLARNAYPQHCVFWSTYPVGCKKADCERKHSKPPNFDSTVVAKVKLE